MTLDDLAGLIREARPKRYRNSRAITGQCPSCVDSSGPHLLAYEGSDGWIHVSCIKGCDEDAIMGALGLAPGDRRIEERGKRKEEGVRRKEERPGGRDVRAPTTPAPKPTSPRPKPTFYIYRDSAGMPRLRKRKFYVWKEKPPGSGDWQWRKEFRQDTLVKREWVEGKQEAGEFAKLLYNLPEVRAAIDAGGEVYVNEGEKACDAMAHHELVGTCQPEGAGNFKGKLEVFARRWLPEHTAEFKGANVTIVADKDAVGEAYARYVAGQLVTVATRVRVVQSATSGEHDDAFDHLAAQFTAADFVERPELMEMVLTGGDQDGRVPGGRDARAPAGPTHTPPPEAPLEVLEKKEPKEFPLTDTGNAERMMYHFGDDLKWCPDTLSWMVFEGHHWAEDKTGGGLVQQRAVRTARLMQKLAYQGFKPENEKIGEDGKRRSKGPGGKEVTKEERDKMYKFGLDSEMRAGLSNMISVAKGLPGVAVLSDQFDYDDYTAGVANGVIDLRTGELRGGRRADMITKKLGCAYDPNAACPEFDEFLQWALGGADGELAHKYFKNGRICEPEPGMKSAREELIYFIDSMMGYTLSGSAKEDKFIFAHGSGGNGKGTLFKLVEAVMGDYAKTLSDKSIMVQKSDQIPQDIAQLRGMRLAIIHETMEGAQFNESLLKTLTGGDKITARKLHENETTFEPHFTLWIAGNHKPGIRTYDPGMERRLRLVPFNAHVDEKEQDPDLKERLLLELPGILARMVRGCLQWQEDGEIVTPDIIRLAGDDYKEESDAILRFIEERCQRGEGLTAGAKDLYSEFRTWSKGTGDFCGKEIWFKRMMQSNRFEQVRRSEGKVWLGIKVVPTQRPLGDEAAQEPAQEAPKDPYEED